MEDKADKLSKLRKRLQDEIDESLDIYENSDIPVSLKKVKGFREI